MPSEAWYHQIHSRLLAEDPTAPAELAENTLDALIEELTKKYPQLRDSVRGSELLTDAAVDALMSYIKKPSQFDPTGLSLFRYLVMSADGDLRNAFAKIKRRKETFLEDVEVGVVGGKDRIENVKPEDRLDSARIHQEIDQIFDTPLDREIARLVLQNERSTEAFVSVLGLEALYPDERRREVKRHKDRIKIRLKRYGEKLREREQGH